MSEFIVKSAENRRRFEITHASDSPHLVSLWYLYRGGEDWLVWRSGDEPRPVGKIHKLAWPQAIAMAITEIDAEVFKPANGGKSIAP